jgi:3-oxoadipate enol-lactonase
MAFFTHNGRRLHYFTLGEGAPVLLVHGFTNAGLSWMNQVAALAFNGYQVIVPDLAGHGLSSPVGAVTTVADLTRDAIALLDHLGVDRVTVCGLSLGGMIAQQAALDFAGRVDRLVVANSRATFATPESAAAVQNWIGLFSQPQGPLKRFQATWPVMLNETFRQSANGQATFDSWCQLAARADSVSLINVALGMREFDVRARLAQIRQPVLVIAGEQDKLFAPDIAREVSDGIAGARLEIIPGASHISSLDSADRFNRLLLEFLRQD